jgi:integrase
MDKMKGHLRKRGERSYEITLYLGRDPQTGKKQYKTHSVKGNKKKAESELTRLVHELETGSYVLPVKLSVGDFLEKWLLDYAAVHVSGKTLERYQGVVKHHLKPALGAIPLQKLQPLHIQAHYSAAMKDGARKDGRPGGLSAQSILHHHRLLSEALQMAVRWQLMARNPCDAVEPPAVHVKEVAALDETKTVWLFDCAIGTRLYVPIVLAVCGGLRRGEILALRWQDVDLASGLLWIRRAVEETKAGIKIKEPKSHRGRRSVTLPPIAVEALAQHRQEQDRLKDLLGPGYQDNDLICCSPDGTLWKPSAFTSAYRSLLARRKLDGPNFHALRHSHASQLLKAGVDIKVISERLGHAKSSFTLDVYGHLLPGRDEEAARRLETGLRAAMEKQRRPVA